MKQVEITIRDKIARLVGKNAVIVCDNSDYIVSFDFDSEWDAYDIKTARFMWNGKYEEKVFTGTHCNIPVIKDATCVEIGVYAGNLSTTTSAIVTAKKSILRGSSVHSESDHTDEDAIVAGTITGYKNDRVTSIGAYAFYRCESLTVAVFPSVTSIAQGAFNDCTSLTEVNFPSATSIGAYAFYKCSSLTTADFPLVTSVVNHAFANCTSLTTANFPLVTSVGDYAFGNSTSLTTADFSLLTNIGTGIFYYCSALTALILRNSSLCTLSSTNAFKGTPIASGTGYIYVPSALIDSYKAATNWKTYAAQFRALEDYTVDGTTTGALDESKI